MFYNFERYIKANKSNIISFFGCVGVLATVYVTAKSVPKIDKVIKEKTEEKGDELNKLEKIKIIIKPSIPIIISSSLTMFCIIKSNKINIDMRNNLITAYCMLERNYDNYRKEIKKRYSENTDVNTLTKITESQEKKIGDDIGWSEDPDKILFYDSYGERYFESTMIDVLKAEIELNKLFATYFYANLNDFYKFLGIGPIEIGECLGWSLEVGELVYGYRYIEFEHKKITYDDGLECYYIECRKSLPTPDYNSNYYIQ